MSLSIAQRTFLACAARTDDEERRVQSFVECGCISASTSHAGIVRAMRKLLARDDAQAVIRREQYIAEQNLREELRDVDRAKVESLYSQEEAVTILRDLLVQACMIESRRHHDDPKRSMGHLVSAVKVLPALNAAAPTAAESVEDGVRGALKTLEKVAPPELVDFLKKATKEDAA